MAKAGRSAFAGLAPDGYAIRTMEPGEAERLLHVDHEAQRLLIEAGRTELEAAPGPAIDDFVRFLVAHDVFVAVHRQTGEPVGYAAARDAVDLYWLAEMAVAPDHGRRGIGRALLRCVLERAGWFFHRAVGLSTYRAVAFNAPFYEGSGFVSIAVADLTEPLRMLLVGECPPGCELADRTVMIRWL